MPKDGLNQGSRALGRALSAALLFVTLPHSFGAEGLIVMRETPLYAKESHDKRAGEVIALLLPGQILLPRSSHGGDAYFVRWTLFSFDVCVDRVDESLDPERYHVIGLLPATGDKWKTGWVGKNTVEKFTYEPKTTTIANTSTGSLQLLLPESYLKGAQLKSDEILSRSFKPPEINNSRSFDTAFPRVWQAVIELLSDRQIPFDLVDKTSGLLTTKAVPDPLANTMACAMHFDERNSVEFNIFVKDEGQSTTVKINASFTALRDRSPIRCYSNGALEKWLFEGIERLIRRG